MLNRLALDEVLKKVDGPAAIYYQPPKSIQMKYPCIVYKRDDVPTKFADNITYFSKQKFLITIIDKNPDSKIPDALSKLLPNVKYVREYPASNLHHFVYSILI